TGILRPQRLSREERVKLIQEKPEYGTIICRCEGISEGELCDAIHRTLGARSLDALKRRVRTGMGRCQAGFCTPKTMEILSGESGIPVMDICKNSSHSRMIIGQKQEESV
ncbi:MAG: (2Fe-2S)-binding protein, partial [Hungatella sp.]